MRSVDVALHQIGRHGLWPPRRSFLLPFVVRLRNREHKGKEKSKVDSLKQAVLGSERSSCDFIWTFCSHRDGAQKLSENWFVEALFVGPSCVCPLDLGLIVGIASRERWILDVCHRLESCSCFLQEATET